MLFAKRRKKIDADNLIRDNFVTTSMPRKAYLKKLDNNEDYNGVFLMLYINKQCWTWTNFARKTDGIIKPLKRIARVFSLFLYTKHGIETEVRGPGKELTNVF